jgi:hypothetical protein
MVPAFFMDGGGGFREASRRVAEASGYAPNNPQSSCSGPVVVLWYVAGAYCKGKALETPLKYFPDLQIS